MKILAVSNFYPPHHIGGYELGCQDVMRALTARGHEVRVLTSRYGLPPDAPVHAETEPRVARALPDPFKNSYSVKHGLAYWAGVIAWERHSLAAWRKVLRDFTPDIIYCWNLSGVSYSLMVLASQSDCPVAFYLSDDWLTHWPRRDPKQAWLRTKPDFTFRRAIKRGLDLAFRLPGLRVDARPLDLRHAQFTSRSLQDKHTRAGLPTASTRVFHWGVDPDRFPLRTDSRGPARRLLYVGQVIPHKGVHTIIEAFQQLHRSGRYSEIRLTIAGGSILPDYRAKLMAMVREAGIENQVCFLGQVAREDLPGIYQSHDILVFPSTWDEPFSITLLEALSSGLPVVGTLTGGTGEILVAEKNALIFPVEDAQTCATQLARLLDDPALAAALADAGHRTVKERFRFRSMVDKIEGALSEAVGTRQTPATPVGQPADCRR